MLEVRELSKRFGAIVAVDNVSFDVGRGEVLGVMGVNGAGKTTLLNCMCGLLKPDSGHVLLNGKDIVSAPAHTASHQGLGRTFQVPRSFHGLTVLENLLVVPARGRTRTELLGCAMAALERVHLDHVLHNYADELSGGQQKLLELARIMMIEPRLILMDEPFAGMHPDLCRLFIEQLEEMVRTGVSAMLVCHEPETLYRLSRRILVIHQGKVICSGGPEEIRRDPAVVDAYLGTAA